MGQIIVLDTGVLGIATNPRDTVATRACGEWLVGQLKRNTLVFIPEIADYELRRELLRANKLRGLRRLDSLIFTLHYDPLTTAAMRHAAQLWAIGRQSGRATAAPDALDADMILCAQALQISTRPRHANDELVVATTNPKHLSPFVAAREWQEIS